MVTVAYDQHFEDVIKKIKNEDLKEKIKKQIRKIVGDPEVGKPMRYIRKDTREVRIQPYRLSYIYLKNQDKIVFLELYHKDKQ
ncbi:MAG: type II toxin-antitoxin system RelE/ParE family toxin [Candidatus Altiarchaeales archaeon]|nr:type II toxin-antitoxin system RelE/ParE family toxin [Candidatus Altiarchaeales archaeon]